MALGYAQMRGDPESARDFLHSGKPIL